MLKEQLMLKWKYMPVTRNLKYLAFLLIGVAFASIFILWKPFSGYYYVFPLTYNQYNYPFTTAQLEGSPCQLGVDIGRRFPLFLQKTILASIEKQFQGTEIVRHIDGRQEEVPYYLIPKLQLGDLVLRDIFAYQSDGKDDGYLGKCLGGEWNLLLDFPHNRMIACDHFSKLYSKGFANEDWIQLPFEVGRIGIIFNVDTDFGTRKLALNTTSMNSMLRSSISPQGAGLPHVSSSFILGGHRFSNVVFDYIELPEDLNEIDGFIGMGYLKEHPIYLDYANKTAYVAPPDRYFTRIPVTFSQRNDPIIEVSLESNTYPLKLDLGSSFSFSLGEEVLEKISKVKYGTSRWYDFKGNPYESPIYIIPEIGVGDLNFISMFINQDSKEFHVSATLIGDPLQFSGVIGWPILEKYNLLLDFPHSAVYASKDLSLIQEAALFSDHLLAIPFEAHPDGIILAVETDAGVHHLLLDTGTTTTAIRRPHLSSTEKFSIMNHDFGECFVMPVDLSSQFDFDGVIGMDFLCKHSLFIDYSNKTLFIDLETRP
jgi:hypothetical protein